MTVATLTVVRAVMLFHLAAEVVAEGVVAGAAEVAETEVWTTAMI
jgi:hypothetical protein